MVQPPQLAAQAPPQPSTPVPELLRAASSAASRELPSPRQPEAWSAASWPPLSRQQRAQEQVRAQV
jgi:hypothetical protein